MTPDSCHASNCARKHQPLIKNTPELVLLDFHESIFLQPNVFSLFPPLPLALLFSPLPSCGLQGL